MKSANLCRLCLAVQALLLFSTFLSAQTNWDTLPWKQYADWKLQNLNKSLITTGILYDRSFPVANVDEYKGTPANNTDTTWPSHFKQAYYELYNAAYNTTGWTNPDTLDSRIGTNGNSHEHPIGIMLYQFNSVDTNALQDDLLDTLVNGQFTDVAGRSRTPYFTHTAFLATPLFAEGQAADTGWHTFYIDEQFFLRNQTASVQSISIDFGDGQPAWVVSNPFNSLSKRTTGFFSSIVKHLTGDIKGRIKVIFNTVSGNFSKESPFKVTVINNKPYLPLTNCKGGGQKWVIEAPASRLAPINTQYGNPKLEYKKDKQPVKDTAYFYFAGNGSTCNMNVLKRPIVFIDGFDPTNSRTVQKIYEDYINVVVDRNGNPETRFGDYLLAEGNDLIILDFKHGNDLLERNAMTLVSLIERLNQTYGSTMLQGITVIGPSMGSLVAQYALAYMETNNIAHNVKTFISFDGCHQGANVPIGLQYFVEHLTKKGVLSTIELVRDGLYNGLAARQMIAHHASAKSNFPAPDALRTQFLQNLAAVGEYPQLCRKVAIINGTNTGTLNPNHNSSDVTLLQIVTQKAGWKSLWGACNNRVCKKFDWKVNRAPNSGNQKVTELWTADPLFNLLSWTPPGQKNYYADAAWGNSSQDNAPGGRAAELFGTGPGQVIQEDILFWLREVLYLFGNSRRTSFSQNLNAFTMMPSYSAADLRFPTKNLYMRWDNQYLCGKTPFDYVYAPPVNEEHVSVSPSSSQWFENEIRCDVSALPTFVNTSITGNEVLCSSGTYSITTCKPGVSVVWSATPSNIVSISGSGTSATVTKVNSGTVVLTATIASCNGTYVQSVSKTLSVGSPSFPYSVAGASPANPSGAYTYTLQTTPSNKIVSSIIWTIPSGWSITMGQGTKNLKVTTGTKSGNVQVSFNDACGLNWGTYKYVKIGPGGLNPGRVASTADTALNLLTGGGASGEPDTWAIAPNPAQTTITIRQNPQPGTTGIKEVKIFDVSGKLRQQKKINAGLNQIELNVSELSAGVYFVEISNEVRKEQKKIVIIR